MTMTESLAVNDTAAPCATTYEGEFKVFTCDQEEWVVARDPEDAAAVFAETGAEALVDDGVAVPWTACNPARTITWNDDNQTGLTTFAELAKRGRGYLGSANY
jgi:hypothetical protein